MESTEHDFIQDEVGEEEKKLAQKLKDLCDSDRKEMKGTELRAALILYELAKIYKQKDEMLNMTRSAALYNAAIVRNPNNQRYKDELEALCSEVLVKANATNRDAGLISLAAEVKEKLAKLREDCGKRFNQLEIIPYGLEGDQLNDLQKKKVSEIKNIQQQVTTSYTELMRFISDECIKIMGAPPCKYAVVGLGSLARSEITLYSDFEHIIIIDNDVAKMEDRKMIIKYFGWFTTIFNIILINLGETAINCVAIPSLNPGHRNWFIDIVTPNGITFDGMAAHACIRPLGRPATKNKPWKTEFIKPVDEMVQYLDSDEQVKQGYHVAEVLSKACFVAGDEGICAEYQEQAHLRIQKNAEPNKFTVVSKQMEENLQTFDLEDLYIDSLMGLQIYNLKKAIYRGATLFIPYIGRLRSLQASSCFDIIDELKAKEECSEKMADLLKFMVAVACEFRAKVYFLKGQQHDVFMEDSDHDDLISDLMGIVGKQSMVSFLEAALVLPQTLKNSKADYHRWNLQEPGLNDLFPLKVSALYFLLLYEDLVKFAEQIISTSPGNKTLMVFFGAAFKRKEYDLVIRLCSKVDQSELTDNEKFELKSFELASIVNRSYNEKTKSFEGSRPEVEAKIKEWVETSKNVKPTIGMLYYSFAISSEAFLLLNEPKIPNVKFHFPDNILALWKQFLKLEQYPANCLLSIVYARVLMYNKEYEEAFKLLQEAKQRMQPYKNTTSDLHMLLYKAFATCYNEAPSDRYYEALICWLEHGRIGKKRNKLLLDHEKQAIKSTFQQIIIRQSMKLCESAATLIKNGKPTEALKPLNKAKRMMQPYKITTTGVHMQLYHECAVCYSNTDEYYKAFVCWLEYARICTELTEPIPDDYKQKIKNAFQQIIFRQSMKLCKSAAKPLNDGKPTEALKLLDKAKQMLQAYKITTTELHMCLYAPYALCYQYAGSYYKALICWLEFARICNELEQPIPDDIKQRTRQCFYQLFFIFIL